MKVNVCLLKTMSQAAETAVLATLPRAESAALAGAVWEDRGQGSLVGVKLERGREKSPVWRLLVATPFYDGDPRNRCAVSKSPGQNDFPP